jgi:pimeloyl-ACP methyl ester carboxylesterase
MSTGTAAEPTSQPPPPPLGRYYALGDRKLWLHRAGAGRPTVVFLAGAGTVGLDYYNVHVGVAEFTTAVTYDRAGTGWSDRVPMPRSSAEVTGELHELLAAAELAPPYLFVGHSLGGLYARHFAARFPGEVTGLVLLDPAHEDHPDFMPAELAERRQETLEMTIPEELPGELPAFYRGLFLAEVTTWPSNVSAPLIAAHLTADWFKVGFLEASNVGAVYQEMRETGPLPAVPTIILCSTGIDGFRLAVSAGEPEEVLEAEIAGRRRLYEKLAASVPKGEMRTVDGVGHVTMHLRRPDAVLQAVRDLLAS